jgi:hypothetical protein
MKISGPIPVYHAANLKTPAVEFAGIEAEIKLAKKQAENQKRMQAAQAELKRYPEYQELMMSDIELSYGKKIKGYQLLKLIQEKQNKQIYGLIPNAKRLMVGALSATIVGGFFYFGVVGCAIKDRSETESFEDMLYTFTNRLEIKKFYKELDDPYQYGTLGRIMQSPLLVYSSDKNYFGLSKFGKKVLSSFLQQEKLGLLKVTSQPVEKNVNSSDVERECQQLIKLLQPVFKNNIDSPSTYDVLKKLAEIDQKRGWFSQKIGQGVLKTTLLKALSLPNVLSREDDLAFSNALSFLMEVGWIHSNQALSRFKVPPSGLTLLNSLSNLESPLFLSRPVYLTIMKSVIQDIKQEKENHRGLLSELEGSIEPLLHEAAGTEKLMLERRSQCQKLKKKGPSVPAEEKAKYLLEADQAVDAFREAEVKHQVMKERLAVAQKTLDDKRMVLGKNLQYLETQLKQLQEKKWITETPSGRFDPSDAFTHLTLLMKQLHAFKNGLATDLVSNTTQQEVDRILTELSVEEKLNQVLASAPETSEP